MNKLICCTIGMLFSVALNAAEMSQYREIERIQYDAKNRVLYVAAKPTGWGAAGCPNATYAHLNEANAPGANTLAALAMQAKAAGTQVAFTGDCQSSDYFLVHYIFVK